MSLSSSFFAPAIAGLVVLNLTVFLSPFPAAGEVLFLDLVAHKLPVDYAILRVWHSTAPAAAAAAGAHLLHDLFRRSFKRGFPVLRTQFFRAARAALAPFRGGFTWRIVFALLAAAAAFRWAALERPFPGAGDNAILDLIALQDPVAYSLIHGWYRLAPGLFAFGGALLLSGAWRVWLETRTRRGHHGRGLLPPWPLSPNDEEPALVLGELHHPVDAKEIPQPDWLTIPERGLYTGIAIFGAVGTGKTSACMHPFARQLFGWQADNPRRRAAGLILEVKGDFCHDIHHILEDHGRGDDYIELGLGGRWQWNPLATTMDSFSLAYTIASLLSQLHGKGKEPFWQQASTNAIRWVIELHWNSPRRWCTLRDIYRTVIDPDTFAAKIDAAFDSGPPPPPGPRIVIDSAHYTTDNFPTEGWALAGPGRLARPVDPEFTQQLLQLGIPFDIEEPTRIPPVSDHQGRLEAIKRWYTQDWMALDYKLRTSIVEGISAFLSLFDLPDVGRLFCPDPPEDSSLAPAPDAPELPPGAPPTVGGGLLQPLPPLDELIESGKVLALNMPAGASPALGRAIGVMLKNAWLQTLVKRPAAMKRYPDRYFRPAVFVCDEYQAFATVGQDDPGGDEKTFALTRQCRCIPIVATQSISSLRAVLPGDKAWLALLQTLRTRIFLSLSDHDSAKQASTICGEVVRLAPSYSISESAGQGFSLVTGRAGGGRGSVGATKSFREQAEPMFRPRAFTLLENCQAIAVPYDGTRSLPATRLYLKPCYLDRERPYWRARAAGQI